MKSVYGISLKALASTRVAPFRGVRRGFNSRLPTTQMTRATSPAQRTAHANPTLGMRYCTVAGNAMAPVPVPAEAIVRASDFLRSKYELTMVVEGIHMRPRPRPVIKPCARRICQYSVVKLVRKVPRTTITEPTSTAARPWPASAKGPPTAQMALFRKIWSEPIQATCEAGRLRWLV